MIQIIAGGKGKGKTKILLDKVNADVITAKGSLVYIDKNTKHMYELNNKVRLISATDYMIDDEDGFLGFICGIISQDHDLEKVYLDGFLKITGIEGTDKDVSYVLKKLENISAKFKVDFVISISLEASALPAEFKDKVIAAL
ncbi:MAG: twitching motility protein PilT [Lachnospiraceae bacterium]|nr:twitching motility protein PilT [Lachnospiraceae bacterium]